MSITKHLDLLGKRVRDKITKFEGGVESIRFDVFGCIQANVVALVADKEVPVNYSFDVSRLDVLHGLFACKTDALSTALEQALETYLGFSVADLLTETEGVVISVDVSTSGRIALYLSLGLDKSGNLAEGYWVFPASVVVRGLEPEMNHNFGDPSVANGEQGCANVSSPSK
jgi:hypothetical protein